MLDLNDLRSFVQVVDAMGITAASRQLRVPKSTLSKRLAALEEALSVRLVQRTSRRFVITDVGQAFYVRAKAAIVEAEAAEGVVRGRLAQPSGPVRVTASLPTSQYRLASFLPELARKYPRVRLELHATDRFVDLVKEGFDIGIRDRFAPLADSELVQRHLDRDPVLLIAARSYLRKSGTPRRPEDLAKVDGLMVSSDATTWSIQNVAGERFEVAPRCRFVADESMVLLNAVYAGLGVACLPHELCRTALAAGRAVRVLPKWTAGSVSTTLLMPHRRGLLPSVRVIADALIERLGGGGRAHAPLT